MKKAVYITLGLVGLYLILENYTGFGQDVGSASSGASTFITALQARNKVG